MKKLILRFWKASEIPTGVKMITNVTAIRWIGWGFAENLIPIFLFSFVGNYTDSGILKSIYEIAMILSLPLIGIMADRIKPTKLILIGLLLYVIVGTSYLFAGITGLVIFVIIARLFNGVGYALDSVGRETYFMRHTPTTKIATAFGYFDTIANFWWIVAALVGIILVKYFALHWLLFLIVPTVIISICIVWNFMKKEAPEILPKREEQNKTSNLLKEIINWNWKLKLLTLFNFFTSFAYTAIMFFLPIQVYKESHNFTPVIIMGVVMTIPALFGWFLGGIFDKKGYRTFIYGLIFFAILLISLIFNSNYLWQTVVVFLVGIIFELLSVGNKELITTYANPEHFGRIDGLSRSISNIGAMTGPIIIGVIIDKWGINLAYLNLSLLMAILALVFIIGNKFIKNTQQKIIN